MIKQYKPHLHKTQMTGTSTNNPLLPLYHNGIVFFADMYWGDFNYREKEGRVIWKPCFAIENPGTLLDEIHEKLWAGWDHDGGIERAQRHIYWATNECLADLRTKQTED